MQYRIAAPMYEATGDPRLDIINPAWSPESRSLSQHGIGDVEASTNAMLLALLGDRRDARSFVDVGAGIGVSSLLCAQSFPQTRVIAVEPRKRPASMLRRIAAANDLDVDVRSELPGALDDAATNPCLVVRVGTTVDASDAVAAISAASDGTMPPVVIVGDRDRTKLLEAAETAGYLVYPLRRFPSWQPLQDDSDAAPADGWLLAAGEIARGLRGEHAIWAGALGACTPDRNDRPPLLAELRSGLRGRHSASQLLTDGLRDLSRGARAIWQLIDPWLPPPRTRPGRVIDRAVALARRLLPAVTAPTASTPRSTPR